MTQEGGSQQRQPSEEEMRRALEEQMRRVTVRDVVLQTVATLVSLSARRLGLQDAPPEERDLEQARLGIESVRALLPLVEGDDTAPVRDALSQLQLAYAREVRAGGEAAQQPRRGGEQAQQAPERPAEEDAERAKARAKIWTPPGV